MKGTIASLVLIALELILCLVSSRWGLIEVNNSQICFKPLLARYNISSTHHQYLHVGPIFSSRVAKVDNTPHHFPSNHAATETALLITGIVLIIISAVTLSVIEFCSNKSGFNRHHIWLHLINVILLTISLILLIIGFYLLQHIFKQPLNGAAALGFFIGILFIVMLATHSAITFWTHYQEMYNRKIEKVAI
jgi:hypothetical protein